MTAGTARRIRWAAVTGVAATVALALPSAAHATFRGSTGDLVWGGQIGDPFDDSQPARQLAPNAAPFTTPRWSPDGTRVAYVGKTGASNAIWIVNADGTGAHQVTNPICCQDPYEQDTGVAWSPDGNELVFTRSHIHGCGDQCTVYRGELRKVAVAGGGNGQLIAQRESGTNQYLFEQPDWSPDRGKIAVDLRHGIPNFEVHSLLLVGPNGGESKLRDYQVSNQYDLAQEGRRISWAPDGKRLAYLQRHGHAIEVIGFDGVPSKTVSLADGKRIAGATFTPDGAHILTGGCGPVQVTDACDLRLLLVPASADVFVDPTEPDERPLTGPGPKNAGAFQPDFQPASHPTIYIHGFLGARMGCAQDELWPTLKWPGALANLRLNDAGTGNAAGTCGARPTALFRTFLGSDIYDSAFKGMERLMPPGRSHFLVWDWRLDPRRQLQKLDALIDKALSDDLSKRQNLDEVVLVGHSFGGLFIRAALEDPARAKRIRRVLTVGTPSWGAPKAIFPLAAGVETPLSSPLDSLMLINSELKLLARNLTGNFWLFPSDRYGRWLINALKPLTQQGVIDYVASLGGSRSIFSGALEAHRQLDGFKKLEPQGLREVRAVVGTGVPTIDTVEFRPAYGQVILGFASGDGTVPGKSAAQGPIGTTKPLGDPIPISYLCNIEHVPLGGHPQLFTIFGDYIRYGTPPRRTLHCPMSGVAFTLRDVDLTPARASSAGRVASKLPRAALNALLAAEKAGKGDVIPFRDETHFVMNAHRPGTVTVKVSGLVVEAERLTDAGSGKVQRFGPVSGKLALGTTAMGVPSLKLNGKALRPGLKIGRSILIGKPKLDKHGNLRVPVLNKGNKTARVKLAIVARNATTGAIVRRFTAGGSVKAHRSRTLVVKGARKRLGKVKRLSLTLTARLGSRIAGHRSASLRTPG